ncbi:MAG: nuclease, partial [Brachymonas sp.]|nr:nuclease [Brachymonas sp.]
MRPSPRGVYFDDPEGLTYIGGGKFVLAEERNRVLNEFTYTAGTTMPANTLTAAEVRTVKLGTTIGNIGIEGLSFDPLTNGFIVVKESGPSGVFQTTVNFAAGTASNGSATATDSINLFTPTLAGLTAINDVFSMSNILTTTAPDLSHILLLSAPDGKIVKMDRTGRIVGTLVVGSTAQNEGMTMDAAGNIYVVSEQGGGSGRPSC